ncbi:MAG: cytochrome c biogenesis protein CcsA [Gammaproteobacteria bacterium]|nr:cytochrome c biogenesis protein CcsA [Gammaproteobacteria bacterium]
MFMTILSVLAILLYLSGTATVAYLLFKRQIVGVPMRLPLIALMLLALILHAQFLYQQLVTVQGLQLDIINMFSLVTALMVAMLLLAVIRKRVENLSIAILPLAALSLILQLVVRVPQTQVTQIEIELELHILLSVVAFSLLSIGAVQAMLLAIQERHLRNHQPSSFIRALPPLESMESLLFQILWIGFAVLTLALFNGLLYLDDMFAQHLVHKTILSLLAWLVFATLLWGRWRYGWRGRTAIRWTLTGIITLLLAYFGSKVVLELILQR